MFTFPVSKLGVAFAVTILIASVGTMYASFGRTTQREKLRFVVESVAASLREVEYLPGKVRMKRRLPITDRSYKLILSGSKEDHQIVNIYAQGIENFQKTVLLSLTVNGGKFRIAIDNPRRIVLSKSSQMHLELL